MTDQTVIDTRNHIEMMKRQHLWPHEVALPLMRRDDNAEGFIMRGVGDSEPPYRVRLGNLAAVALGVTDPRTLKFIDYSSAELVYAAGWEVD